MNIVFPLNHRKLLLGFQGHVAQGRGGAADYEADFETLYAPVSGRVYLFNEESGGKWIGIIDQQGRKWEMAHLSERYVKEGDVAIAGAKIGKTGN